MKCMKQSKINVLVCPRVTGLQTTRVLDTFKSTDERKRMYRMSTMYIFIYTRALYHQCCVNMLYAAFEFLCVHRL